MATGAIGLVLCHSHWRIYRRGGRRAEPQRGAHYFTPNVYTTLPTIIDTPQNRADMPGADPGKWVAPEALADVVLFLASDAARAVNGALVPVTGLS